MEGGMAVKATGIVRKVDELGRIVLPIEMRRTLDIAEKDALEIYVEGASVILKKYKPSCIFCDTSKDVSEFKGKNICPKCLKDLKNL
jgi:transcriptional pleiotropic regulator of transition state genes